MKASIDHAGRLVIPKPLRDQLGINEKTPLSIEARDGEIVIAPVTPAFRAVKRGAGLVLEAEGDVPPLTAEMVREVLESVRK